MCSFPKPQALSMAVSSLWPLAVKAAVSCRNITISAQRWEAPQEQLPALWTAQGQLWALHKHLFKSRKTAFVLFFFFFSSGSKQHSEVTWKGLAEFTVLEVVTDGCIFYLIQIKATKSWGNFSGYFYTGLQFGLTRIAIWRTEDQLCSQNKVLSQFLVQSTM